LAYLRARAAILARRSVSTPPSDPPVGTGNAWQQELHPHRAVRDPQRDQFAGVVPFAHDDPLERVVTGQPVSARPVGIGDLSAGPQERVDRPPEPRAVWNGVAAA